MLARDVARGERERIVQERGGGVRYLGADRLPSPPRTEGEGFSCSLAPASGERGWGILRPPKHGVEESDATRTVGSVLRACKQSPDDAQLRLVLADWLEEHGLADRARCVQLTVHAAELGSLDDDWRSAIQVGMNDLRHELTQWLRPLRAIFPHSSMQNGPLRVIPTSTELEQHRPEEIPPKSCPGWRQSIYGMFPPLNFQNREARGMAGWRCSPA